jgi:hypothetical protein
MSITYIRIAPSINRAKLAFLAVAFWTIVFISLTISNLESIRIDANSKAEQEVEQSYSYANRCLALVHEDKTEVDRCKQLEHCSTGEFSCRRLNETYYDKIAYDYAVNTRIRIAAWYITGLMFFFVVGRIGLATLEALASGALAGWRTFRTWITN